MSVSIIINRNPVSRNTSLFDNRFGDTVILLPLSGASLNTTVINTAQSLRNKHSTISVKIALNV